MKWEDLIDKVIQSMDLNKKYEKQNRKQLTFRGLESSRKKLKLKENEINLRSERDYITY